MRVSKMMVIAALALLVCFPMVAGANETVDPLIPDSWYEAPQLASERGVTEFSQSPFLDEQVAEGVLPSVADRLPNDPPTLEPYAEVGQYGGTLNIWSTSLSAYGGEVRHVQSTPNLSRAKPDATESIPHLAKGWEISDDAMSTTIYLREGLKWSDGHPFTSADYLYWWEYVANDPNLTPSSPQDRAIPLVEVTAEDDYTVTFHFGSPNPRFVDYTFHLNIAMDGRYEPAHYMKQFHPAFADEDELQEQAQAAGFDHWYEYYNRVAVDSASNPQYEHVRPCLAAYIAVEKTETYMILERNPYYAFVDSEGNQLPYVDRVRVNLASNAEMARTQASMGLADVAGRYTTLTEMPLYSRNAEREDYRVLMYGQAYGGIPFHVNLSHPDEELGGVFRDFRFRQALSHAVNRDEVNERVWFGQANVRQSNVPDTSIYFEEEFATAYIEYNPEVSRQLLDEMGLVDVSGDGYRDLPSGESFDIAFLMTDWNNPLPTVELLVEYFRDIGLNIRIDNVSRELFQNRKTANEFEMSYWDLGVNIDLFFGNLYHLAKSFAPTAPNYEGPWPAWGAWYQTEGEEGIEPPDYVMPLYEHAEVLNSSPDPEARLEAGKALARGQAENLWTIGIVQSQPQPIIVKNYVQNVPTVGIWDAALPYLTIYNPEQFYIQQ